MFSLKQPKNIIIGKNSANQFEYPDNSLLITSKGAKTRGWIEYLNFNNNGMIFDQVENNPSMNTVDNIIQKFSKNDFSCVIGLGGGSCLDVAKYVGFKLNKRKILVPTTFGSGSEVTRISVLKINGEKKSFHDDQLLANIAIIDPFFIKNTPFEILRNSAIDACAQCTEAYDSLSSNVFTRFLCNNAFDILENSLLNNKYDELAYGALISGLGFGNSSTTLGHALSYVFSNEGISHGHALAFTTMIAHKFNNSKFFTRFKKLVLTLNFPPISLKKNIEDAAFIIQKDKKHLDNNPKPVTTSDIIKLLSSINSQKTL